MDNSYNQPTSAPTTKVAAGGLTGAASIVFIYILSTFHVTIPPEVASAITVILSFAASYFIKEQK